MDDKILIQLLHKNPARAVHELMTLYGGAIATICRNFLYDCTEEDVEEAIADTFINFWKKRESFQWDERYSVKSYLYTIARNVSRDKRRNLKKADIYSLEELNLNLNLPSGQNLELEYEKKEQEAILHTCLEQMKEPDKSVFLYRYFYGYKVSEIGKMLNLPAKKVENILYRGKEKLRKDLLERGICRG